MAPGNEFRQASSLTRLQVSGSRPLRASQLAERQGSGTAKRSRSGRNLLPAAEVGASQEAFQEGRVQFRDGVLAL